MTVPDSVIQFCRISEGNTPRNTFSSRRVHSICSVHQQSLENFPRNELSNSRYSRQVIESGNVLLNFISSLILPLSICDELPVAPRSGVKSKSNMK